MEHQTTIDLTHDSMVFCAGHFTIFSATERERLHGHNFWVGLAVTGRVDDNGLLSDYSAFRRTMIGLCRELHEVFLLPDRSPHLELRRDGGRVEAIFDGKAIPFLEEDVRVLPVRNVSLEELSRYLCERFLDAQGVLDDDAVVAVEVRVCSKPKQCASFAWKRNRRDAHDGDAHDGDAHDGDAQDADAQHRTR